VREGFEAAVASVKMQVRRRTRVRLKRESEKASQVVRKRN
jgi:hypothetical protein